MAINLSEKINMEEWVFFLTGGISLDNPFKNNIIWLPNKNWDELCRLDKLPKFEVFDGKTFITVVSHLLHTKNLKLFSAVSTNTFQNIKADFEANTDEWKKLYDSLEPHLANFPDPWDKHLDYFQKCLVLRVIRYDKIIPAIRHFISRKFHYLITAHHDLITHL